MARYDDVNTPLVAVVGLVSVLALVGIIVGLQGLYLSFERAEVQRKVIAVDTVDAKNLLAEQEASLNRAGWLDREKGLVAIPIERAMELVAKECRERRQDPDDA